MKKPDYSCRTDTISSISIIHHFHRPVLLLQLWTSVDRLSRLPSLAWRSAESFRCQNRVRAGRYSWRLYLVFSSEGLLFHCDLVDLYIERWDCKEVGENERETGEKKRRERENEVNDWIESFSNCGIFLSNAIRAALGEGRRKRASTNSMASVCAYSDSHDMSLVSNHKYVDFLLNRPTVIVAVVCCRSEQVQNQITISIYLYLRECVCVWMQWGLYSHNGDSLIGLDWPPQQHITQRKKSHTTEKIFL